MQQILETLLRLAVADAERFAHAKRRNAALYLFAVAAGLTAYVCAVGALVLLVAQVSDPLIAATFVAASFGALALIVLAVVAVLNHRERVWRHERRAVYSDALTTVTRSALGPGGLALVAAAVMAGLAMSGAESNDTTQPPRKGEPDSPS